MLGSLGPWQAIVDAGAVIVDEQIRGGGERGYDWWTAGRMLNRPYAFTDVVAQALVREGIAAPERIGLYGLSNGALTVAGAVMPEPELFRAAVAAVRHFDMLATNLYTSGARTRHRGVRRRAHPSGRAGTDEVALTTAFGTDASIRRCCSTPASRTALSRLAQPEDGRPDGGRVDIGASGTAARLTVEQRRADGCRRRGSDDGIDRVPDVRARLGVRRVDRARRRCAYGRADIYLTESGGASTSVVSSRGIRSSGDR